MKAQVCATEIVMVIGFGNKNGDKLQQVSP